MAFNGSFSGSLVWGSGFTDLVNQTITNYLKAAKMTVKEVTRAAELKLESEMVDAGLGRLHKVWSSDVYPSGNKLAYAPSGDIYLKKGGPRTQGAIRAYSEGGTIRPKAGSQYLAVPLPSAGRGTQSQPLTPQSWSARTGQQLTFIPGRGSKPAMLVALGNVGSTGRYRRATARQTQRGTASMVPIFLLIKEVSVRKRFSIEGTVRPFENLMVTAFEGNINAVTRNTP